MKNGRKSTNLAKSHELICHFIRLYLVPLPPYSKDLPDNIIGRTRQRRSLYNCFLTFDAEKVPEKPNEAAKEQLENFGVEQKFIEKVKVDLKE